MKMTRPKRKVAVRWRKQHLIGETVCGIPLVASLFAGAYWSRWMFLVALLVFAWGFTMQRLRFRKCICETCGAKLQRVMKSDSAIEFFCQACNTVWTTKVIQDGEAASV